MPDFSMPSETEKSSSPKVVIDAVSMIPQGLVPGTIKAIDRLIGAAIDVPAAWLRQQTVKIEAKSQSLASVEAAVGQLAISELGSDGEVGERALSVLLRKEYRRQTNRQAVVAAMIEDIQATDCSDTAEEDRELDDDWLNVFERYAEDASTERMQRLWGRVLSGEVRKPGSYSMRTLRFL